MYLNRLDWNDKLAIATSLERVRNDRYFPKFIHCFGDLNNIQKYPMRIFMRNDFPLRSDLNRFIGRLSENNLITRWMKQHSFGSRVENERQFRYIEIAIDDYLVIGLICVCVLILACIVFALERLVYKKARTCSATRFWRYLEMVIDPYRYFFLQDLSY